MGNYLVNKYGLVTTRRIQNLERNLGVGKEEMSDLRGSGMYASALGETQTGGARSTKPVRIKFTRGEMGRVLAAMLATADVRGNIKRNGIGKVMVDTLGVSLADARGRAKTLRHRKLVRELRAKFYGGKHRKVAVCLRITKKGMNLIREVCPDRLPANIPAPLPRRPRRVLGAEGASVFAKAGVTEPASVPMVAATCSATSVDERYARVKQMAEEYAKAKAMLDDPLYARAAEIVGDPAYQQAVEHFAALNKLLDEWDATRQK